MYKPNQQPISFAQKRGWHAVKFTDYGKISDIIQQGNGKTNCITGDPGEPRKVPSLDS